MVPDDLARRIVTASRKGKEWVARRDALIVAALEAGATQAEVAKLAGLSQPAISGIWQRHHSE